MILNGRLKSEHDLERGTLMYALVTGATSGIGKEIAKLLAKRNIDLILTGRRVKELDELKTELETAHGVKAVVIPADLSDRDAVKRLHEQASAYQPEIVVNNAGFGIVDHFIDIPLENEIAMIETNIVALHALTKRFARSMTQGTILNVASMAGFLPTPRMASYAATKSYVYSLSMAVDHELKHVKPAVRIKVLCPGPVDTGFADVAGVKMALSGISAEHCAKVAVKGLFSKRRVIVPDGRMRLTKFFLRILPVSWVLSVSYRLQSKK